MFSIGFRFGFCLMDHFIPMMWWHVESVELHGVGAGIDDVVRRTGRNDDDAAVYNVTGNTT